MKVHNLLALPDLPTRHTKGKKPPINYSQSHIVINSKYLDIQNRKAMENVVGKEIKEGKSKEKEDKWSKRTTKLGFPIEQVTQKTIKKCARA